MWNDAAPVPLVSLVGGKLTTCRSLAEETAAAVLARLGRKAIANSRERPIPKGSWDVHLSPRSAVSTGGTGYEVPEVSVRDVIRDEWVTRLEDLVERRLLLHFHPGLSREVLRQLGTLMVAEGKLSAGEIDLAVERVIDRLASHFGRRIE
jgi:glycerol-3-phosphate dehydrogenase